MEELKVLKPKALNQFIKEIKDIKQSRSNRSIKLNDNFIVRARNKIGKKVEIEKNKIFSSKYEMGKYLCNKLSPVDSSNLLNLPGLWNWFSYLWFDQVCPIENEKRKVYQISRYIYDFDFRKYYRHLILSSWFIYENHKKYSKVMLYNPVYQVGDMHEQLASRQDIFTNKNLIEVAYNLYWDENNESLKTGATSKNYDGNVRRLIDVSFQLDLTYDLHVMSADDILSLLPSEFNAWK